MLDTNYIEDTFQKATKKLVPRRNVTNKYNESSKLGCYIKLD